MATDTGFVGRLGNPDGGPTRSDTWRITLSLNGENFGVWDKLTGGDVDSEEYKYKPGGMAPHVSLGGTRTTNNITVQRLYRLGRDHLKLQKLINQVGKGHVVVHKQPLDVEGNAFGKPIVYRGTLKRVKDPDVDSESSSAGMIEIEITTDGFPTAH